MITTSTMNKLLALQAIGICDGLREQKIDVLDAEKLLFSPHTMRQASSCDKRIAELIHLGTELGDIKDLVPEDYENTLDRIRALALSCLKDSTKGEISNQNPWIDLIT